MAVNVDLNLNPNTRKVEAALARIQAQAKGVDFGGGARSIDKLSRPLGKITGQASEFQKSLEASNARVLAFGASVAVINKLSQAFGALVSNTIKVEASFAKINTILGGTQKQLQQFGDGIFKVAQKTATSFDQVAEGALELARQGLSVEESLSRVETALKLVRVAGIDSQQAVAGLTAAIKGFEGAGLNVAQIADKLAEVDTKFAVSTEDLINGLERASASARVAGVSFDELLGVITTVQERTQRGGAVIGNAFKTIFARLGRTDTLVALEELGIQVLDSQGNVRSAIPLFQELAVELDKLGLKSLEAGEVIQKVAGVRQRDILISLVEDLNSSQSQFAKSLQVSAGAAGALDAKNSQLNDTLEALINNLTTGAQKLSAVIGELGFTDAAKDILSAFSSVVNGITDLLQGDSMGAKFAQGLIKGIGSILTGPGLALVSAIFVKLFVDLAKFGATSLKSLLGINKAAELQNTLQQSVFQTLLQNEAIQKEILALEGNKVAQEQLLLKIYNQQAAALARVQKAAATVSPGLFNRGFRGGEGGVGKTGRGAGGYVAAEASDVSRGVGGAPASSKVVSIPNFAFGGGKRGTMVANTSEYYVPNYSGGGDAIFNRDMVRSSGLPSGARKINAADGFIPNFASAAKMSSAFNSMSGSDFVSKFGQSEFNLRQRAAATGMTASERKRRADKLKKDRKGGKQKGSYSFDSLGKIGVLSAFARGGSSIANTTVQKLSRIEQENLKSLVGLNKKEKLSPSTAVSVKGIQNRSLENIDKSKVSNFRKNIDTAFAPALIDFATTLIGGVGIQNDEMGEFVKKVKSGKGNLFSTSVEGGIFESAIQLGTKKLKEIRTFLKGPGNDRSPFDFEEAGNASENLIKAFRFNTEGGQLQKADAKRSSTPDAVASLIGKSLRDGIATQFVRKGAGGYIPNFAAGSGLEDAIGREQAAGVPINQIRVNQSGKLRNSQNPKGLAVTNTRDEPTGRIPNFAREFSSKQLLAGFGGKAARDKELARLTDSAGEASSALDTSITKIFALQLATSALTSTFAEQGGKMEQFGNALSSAINTMLVLSTVGASPLGALGRGKGGGFKGLAPFIKGTKGLTRVFGILKGVAGPVALGLTGISVAMKLLTGKGLFQTLGEGFGLLASETQLAAQKINEAGTSLGKGTEGKDVTANIKSRAEAVRAARERAGIQAATPTLKGATDDEIRLAGILKNNKALQNSTTLKGKSITMRDFSVGNEDFSFDPSAARLTGSQDFGNIDFKTRDKDIILQNFSTGLFKDVDEIIAGLSGQENVDPKIVKEFLATQDELVASFFEKTIEGQREDFMSGIVKGDSEKVSQGLSQFQIDIEEAYKEMLKKLVKGTETSEGSFVPGAIAKRDISDEFAAGRFAARGFDRSAGQNVPGTGGGKGAGGIDVLSTTLVTPEKGRKTKILEKELKLAKAISIERKVQLENEIALEKFALKASEEKFEITEKYVKSIEDSLSIEKKEVDLMVEMVNKGKDLKEIEEALLALGIEKSVLTTEEFQQALKLLGLKNRELAAEEKEIENQNKINDLKKPQGFGEGLRKGLGNLKNDIAFFGDELGKNIPQQFSDNLGTAMKDAISGAATLEEALLGAASNFAGTLADAFIDQAAKQATASIMGGFEDGSGLFGSIGDFFKGNKSTAAEPVSGSAGSVFKAIEGDAGNTAAIAAADSAGEKKGGIGGFFSGLFGGGKKTAAPGTTATNPLFVQDVGSIKGGAGGAQAESIEGAIKEGLGGEGEGQKGFFGGLKDKFGDLFGGLKQGLGDIFGGFKQGLSGLFSGGAGGGIGGLFSSVIGGFSSGFGGIGKSIGSFFGFANGGKVGSTDTVPAMLTPGEFVVKKSAVDKYGTNFLSSLNNGVLPMQGFQNGGAITPVSSEIGNSVSSSSITNNSEFSFSIEGGSASQTDGESQGQDQRQFADRVRQAVTTVIQEESRMGGSLNYLRG